MSALRNRRVVTYSAAAVAVAIALTAAVSLAFPTASAPSSPEELRTFAPGFCPSEGLWLNGPRPVTGLTPNGTTKIGGTTYVYATVVPTEEALAGETYRLEGVNFTMISASSGLLTDITQWSITNGTVLTAPIEDHHSCSFYLPSFGIALENGPERYLNSYTADLSAADLGATWSLAPSPGSAINVNAAGNNATLTFQDPPSSNPWFFPQAMPQVGVGYEIDGGKLTFYVSYVPPLNLPID